MQVWHGFAFIGVENKIVWFPPEVEKFLAEWDQGLVVRPFDFELPEPK